MAVDRQKFLELGGFNRLFHPAYCEDLDLCFRAWRRGWRCIYEPGSVVWHREQGSWATSKVGKPNQLNIQSSLLFQWSSLPMTQDRGIRWKSLFKLLLGSVIQGDFIWAKGCTRSAITWAKSRKNHLWMKTSKKDLNKLLSKMAEPVLIAKRSCKNGKGLRSSRISTK